MKWMAIAVSLTVAAPALAEGPAAQSMPAYPGVPADLAKAAADFDLAQVKGDAAALKRVLADDFLLLNSQDKREDKTQFIADYTTKGFTMEPFAIDDQVIKVWADGAVLGGAVTAKGMSDGKPYSVRIRFSDVWAKRRQVASDLRACQSSSGELGTVGLQTQSFPARGRWQAQPDGGGGSTTVSE